MSRALGNCDCVQAGTLAFRNSAQEKRSNISRVKFLDLPFEVRNIIYKYLFDGAVLRIGKNGIEHEHSWGHCEILRTCQAVFREAQPALFSQATQVFSDADCYVKEKSLNLLPIFPRSVPALNVYSYEPKNNVRLDMKTLRTYSHLRLLELGMFSFMRFEQAPYHILEADAETVNEANNPYMVTEIKKTVTDKTHYSKLQHKPLCLAGLRGILQSKHRKFAVRLCCIVDMFCVDVYDELPAEYDGMKVLLDWDNDKLLENELN